jgi:hypothetical protein
MNIKDIEQVVIPEGDKLDGIFVGQQKLMDKYHHIEVGNGIYAPVPPLDLHSTLHQARLKDLAFRIITEIIEATECLKNKPWKQTHIKTDVDHFYEEVSDALHFFVEFCINAGITSEMLCKLYHLKHQVNEFRQRSQY